MARKQRKAIISCAVTGAIHVPSLTPHLPITPEEIADTEEAARKAIADYDAEVYVNLYKALTPVMPLDPADPVQSVVDCGLWMYGTPEMVRDQFVAQWQELPAEYVVLIFHYAQMPADAVIRNMELFMEHVKPALDELTEYAPAGARA